MTAKDLEKLGYDECFQEAGAEPVPDGFAPARVIEVNKNSYMVADGNHEMIAELSGKFLYDTEGNVNFPTVGDWVMIQAQNDNTLAIIHSILPRRTLLKRKESGKRIGFQLIAANIDFGLIMQSAKNINFNLLDRYFVMLNECRIQPLAVFTKIDLLSPSEMEALRDSLSKLNNEYLLISNISEGGIEELANRFISGKTYCLLGESGVGKTSLLNRLLEADMLRVNEVRAKDGKGRHTTVKRQLVCLDSGSIFIDTPGMRELGNFEIGHGLEQTFDDFATLASQCRFRDCTHTHEKGCAVVAAVKSGEIEEGRYDNFLKLKKEAEFYDMSYREKRQKDKSFGKMIKNFKKSRRGNQE